MKDASQKCWNDIDFKKMERQLSVSPVQSKTLMDRPWTKKWAPFYNPPPAYMLKLKSKAYPGLKAIWKPEAALLHKTSALFAYRLSKALKLNLVPPTALRSIEGKEGILQLFVEAIPYDTEEWREVWRRLPPKQRAAAFAFYFILGYQDIKQEHILIGRRCKRMALIDNDSALRPAFIALGQWPYHSYRLSAASGGKYPVLRFEDYSSFPLYKPRPFEARSREGLRHAFPNMGDRVFRFLTLRLPRHPGHWKNKERRLLSLKKTALIQTIGATGQRPCFILWKGLYWIQDFRWPGLFVFSDMPPKVYSGPLIKALKGLNREALESFFPPLPPAPPPPLQRPARNGPLLYGADLSETQGRMAWLAAGALKRRDMLLKEGLRSSKNASRGQGGRPGGGKIRSLCQ